LHLKIKYVIKYNNKISTTITITITKVIVLNLSSQQIKLITKTIGIMAFATGWIDFRVRQQLNKL